MMQMTRRRVMGGAALLAASPARAASRVLVAAASDLQAVFPKLADAFKAASGVSVEASFGSTGNFARQIRQGAPFEVFLAADEAFIAALARDGVIADDGAAYARGQLAVVAAKRGPFAATPELSVLAAAAAAGQSFRLAIANPEHAPYGQRAIEVLAGRGLLDVMKPRLIYGESATQALQFVASGAAAAGITAMSLAAAASDVTVAAVPPAWHTPLIQRLAVTRKGGAAARQFAAFMVGPDAQSTLGANGFLAA